MYNNIYKILIKSFFVEMKNALEMILIRRHAKKLLISNLKMKYQRLMV